MSNKTFPASVLVKHQKTMFQKNFTEDGRAYTIIAEVRHDDQCGNGHNSFSITGTIWNNPRRNDCLSGGCIHDEIKKHFPDLAKYLKWHLTSTDGPMHYIANTVYLAGNRDCNGLRKGEFKQFKESGLPVWELDTPRHKTMASTEKPSPSSFEWKPYGREGEGKDRELDFARSAAVWPEATDKDLTCEPEELKRKLEARLPALMQEFKKDVEALGFIY